MKIFQACPILLAFCLFYACGDVSSGETDSVSSAVDSTHVVEETTTEPAVKKPDCEIAGNVLDGNLFWAKNENRLICIAAGEQTYDAEFGESHRILEAYDANTCEKIDRKILPVNVSPDFPYYLSEITYNKASQIVGIKGYDKIYCYHAGNQNLSAAIQPEFLNERYGEDAQSGRIDRLEVWENYLIGYAAGMGTFVFELKNDGDVSAVLPMAEFELEAGVAYNSLFLLKSKEQAYQLILPTFDLEKDEFAINPLLEQPKNIQTQLNRKFRNNRYLVLKELLGDAQFLPVAIDMKEMKRFELPAEIADKSDTEIIDWMKSN